MDLRSIMNNDAAPNPPPPPPPAPARQSSSSSQTPVSVSDPLTHRPHHHHHHHHHPAFFSSSAASPSPSSSSHPLAYPNLPPQQQQQQQQHPPPPLRPPPAHPSPDRSSSYGSIQSPYQYNSAPALSAGVKSQRAHSPPHVLTNLGPSPRDLHQGQQHHVGPPLASPFLSQPMSAGVQYQEQPSYFLSHRSHSVHSVPTSSTTSKPLSHPKESPQSAASQHSFHRQQFPPQSRRSVSSSAPLGLLSTPYPQLSPQSTRPPSTGYDSHQLQSPGSYFGQDTRFQNHKVTMSPSAQPALPQDVRRVEEASLRYSTENERDNTASISPRTMMTSAPRQGSVAENFEHTSPQNRREDVSWKGSPLNSPASYAAPAARHVDAPLFPQEAPTDHNVSVKNGGSFAPQKMENNAEQVKATAPPPPKRKKIRYSEPPVFARKAVRNSGVSPAIPNPRPPIPKHARGLQQSTWSSPPRKSSLPQTSTSKSRTGEGSPANGHSTKSHPLVNQQNGGQDSWEPSITNIIPYEEITKVVCDFLFQHVVVRGDAAAGTAGTAAAGQGAIVEVEAKLGRLIDQDFGERLRIPVMTETVLNRAESRFRTSFESCMTLQQHRTMNNFLNEAVKASTPHIYPGRTQISYAHKKERDTFYEVTQHELPPIIRQNLNPRHKPKVRVTTDQQTGEVVAKIIKCRVADIDVYSPRTSVDWRISVNLEMEYTGDVRHLPVVDVAKGRGGDRNKDRMSYRHQAYQIDLTQVAKSESQTRPDFEHELEIELSAAEVRHQGQLAIAGDPGNKYQDLIKGFLDNIRILARTVPP